jgi:fluoride exporter
MTQPPDPDGDDHDTQSAFSLQRADDWDDLPLDPDFDVGTVLPPVPRRHRRPSGRADPRVLLAIALGAMGGATARYKVATLITVPVGGFPWATFWANVTGSLVLGFLLVLLIERFPPTRYARAFVGTGFLGAYTTFSTFAVETDVLIKDGHAAVAAAYVAASLSVGIFVAWLGVALGRLVPYRRLERKERP